MGLVKLARAIVNTIRLLFKMDRVTGMASVEMWVVVTTALLVVRFLLDFFGSWYANWCMVRVVVFIEILNYSMVHYVLGLMQLSTAARVNDYFQVWAVLLVTLQCSVKIGRPYSRSKQSPIFELMSSFWAANLLRMKTFFLLRIPLWIIWALNAARIISYFFSSDKAAGINHENTRLVSGYMSYEHTLGSSEAEHAADVANSGREFTMEGYKYLVLGEDLALKQQQELETTYKVRLSPDRHGELITLEKIWNVDAGESGLLGAAADPEDKLKDVCLSFALYKLLRRRFYDLPIHEARLTQGLGKARRLVFQYVAHSHERAFRVAALELSFLQDLFYSKHAAMFAGGFPTASLLLSLFLVTATGFIAYPVRYIPGRLDKDDRNRITHGVFITRLIVALIIVKELAEIYMYVFSQWTKVLILCSYARRRWMRQCRPLPLAKAATTAVLALMTRGKWNERIRQHSLLVSSRWVRIGININLLISQRQVKLEDYTKQAILESFKRLEEDPAARLGSYFSAAFGSDEALMQELRWVTELEADTHRILVWHIATCLCEIDLSPEEEAYAPWGARPFVKKPEGADPEEEVEWWQHYTTAASLSNYCAYLVTQSLVPDNGIVAKKVFFEVCREINHVILDRSITSLFRRRSMRDVYRRLKRIVDDVALDEEAGGEEEEAAPQGEGETKKQGGLDIKNSLTIKGAKLGMQLVEAYGEDRAGLWRDLAVFWTEFLLHLAAHTRASKHRTRLNGRRELVTHLWALLSHAGFLGSTTRGHQLLDQDDLQDANPPTIP